MLLAIQLLVACGGAQPPEAATTAPAAAPARQAARAAAVGPDGPDTIDVPAVASIPTDAESVKAGEGVFGARGCGGCHKFGSKLVGPDLKGVTGRRSVTWMERQITAPDVMTKQDPVARDLFKTYMVQMPAQGVTAEEMPELLAYIKAQGG